MDMTSAGTDHWCKNLRKRRVNKTIAGFVCLKGMMRGMVPTRGKEPSSKMERLGTRAARSTKNTKKTDNQSTAISRKTEKDRPRGKKTAMLGKGTERMLDTGSCMDMENDDQPVLF